MDIGVVIGAAVAALTALAAAGHWFYKRGRDEQSLSSSIDRQAVATSKNTEATEMLAAQVGGLRDTLEAHGNTLTEHHWRLKALEGSK